MKNNIIPMIMSKSPELELKEMATYLCEECGISTAVQESINEPFCSNCGNGELESVDNEIESEIDYESEDDLVSAQCNGCKQYSIFTKESYSKLESKDGYVTLHCPLCASKNNWSNEEDDTNIYDIHSKEGRILCKKHDTDDLASIICDSCENESVMTIEAAAEITTSDGMGTLQCPSCSEDIVFQSDELSSGDEDDENDEDDIDDEDNDEDEDSDDLALDDDNKDDDANIKNVDLIQSTNTLYAISDDTIIAKLDVTDKSSDDVYALTKALSLSFKDKDAVDVLVDNDFTLSDGDNNFVDVASIKSKMKQDTNKYFDVVFQSMGIAFCGVNRNFFQEENPLYNSLVDKLSDIVDEGEAKSIVSKAFADSSDEYVDMIRNTTKEISEKSDDVRNELSKTIMGIAIPVKDYDVKTKIESQLSDPLKGHVPNRHNRSNKGSKIVELTQKSRIFHH